MSINSRDIWKQVFCETLDDNSEVSHTYMPLFDWNSSCSWLRCMPTIFSSFQTGRLNIPLSQNIFIRGIHLSCFTKKTGRLGLKWCINDCPYSNVKKFSPLFLLNCSMLCFLLRFCLLVLSHIYNTYFYAYFRTSQSSTCMHKLHKYPLYLNLCEWFKMKILLPGFNLAT